jgi:hypothetical protein
MKKYLPLLILIFFLVASFIVKLDLLIHSNTMSYEEKAFNYCAQFITIFPVATSLGLTVIIMPKLFLSWIDSILGTQLIKLSPLQVFILRIFGIVMVIAAIRTLQAECVALIR